MRDIRYCKAEVLEKSGKYGEEITVNVFSEIDPEIAMETGLGQNHVKIYHASQRVAYVLPQLYPGDHILMKGVFRGEGEFFTSDIQRYEPKVFDVGDLRDMLENTKEYVKYDWINVSAMNPSKRNKPE